MAAADQTRVHDGDVHSTTPDSALRILHDQHDTVPGGADLRATTAADSAALVNTNALPSLQIVGHDSPSTPPPPKESGFMHFLHGAETVVSDLATGAVNEVVNHPGQVVEYAAIGLAVGTVAVLAAPEVALGMAVVGTTAAAIGLATHVGGWIHDADVVSNTQDHTQAEVAAAHQGLQDVGGGAVLVGAGLAGSLGAAPLAGAISDVAGLSAANAASAESGTVDDILANAVRSGRYEEVQLPNGMSYFRPTEAAAAADTTATATAADATATATDAPLAAEPAALTPEEIALKESIARNQSIFAAAHEQGEVVPSVKQLYQVHFEQAGPGGRVVPTLENPAGVQVPEGGWVATRLNADGTPNIENGMVNQWTPSPKEILKQYLITPEQLANQSDIVGFTNTSAPPVHMVKLDAPMDFQTPWGPMHADAGDWLSNYDFDTATGRAGSDFARVTARSYQQTYEPVPPQE